MAVRSLKEARDLWLAPIEERIAATCADNTLLGDMIAYHFATGGKRIRGILPPLICASLGGDADAAIPLGAGLEILHNATLVHDDIQDGDTHRRGQETVWAHWGAPQGINVGDSLFFHGLSLIAQAPAGPLIMEAVCQAMQRVVRGQVMEFQLQLPASHEAALPHRFEAFEEMARSKTGALFGICMEAGARAAGGDETLGRQYRDYGVELGLLFQVQDDYLDLVGNKGRDLKGSDLAEGKLSFPVVWAYANADASLVTELQAIVRRPRAQTSAEDVQRALDLLDVCGALSATATWLRDHRDEALASPCAAHIGDLVELILQPVNHAMEVG